MNAAAESARPAARPAWRQLGAWGLPFAVGVYLVLRGLILYTAFDQTAMTMYELYPMGTLAELVRRGIEFPVRYFYDNAAGQILIGGVTVPFFALFGPSYLTLKLVPLTLGLLTLLLAHRFLAAHFSRAAANVGALLFALGPTTLVKYSLMNSGNHFENLCFTMLVLVCCYRFHQGGERRWLLASGFSAGFALFVFLGALIPVGLLAGLHLGLRGLRKTARDVLWAGPAFVLGLAPLIALNIATGARGMGFLGAKFGDALAGDAARVNAPVLERGVEFLSVHLPRAGVYASWAGLPGVLADRMFLCAFVLAWIASLPCALLGVARLVRGTLRAPDDVAGARADFERAKLVPLVLYLPLAALAYGLSNFRIGGHAPPIEIAGYRYFLPHFLCAVLLIAIVATRAWARARAAGALAWAWRAGSTALAGGALCAGLFNLAIVDTSFEHKNVGAHYPGYNLAQVARALLSSRNAVPQAEIIARVQQFPPPMRQHVTTAIGFNTAVHAIEKRRAAAGDGAWRFELPEQFAAYPESWQRDLARGAGIALHWLGVMSGWKHAELDRLLAGLVARDVPGAAAIIEGVALENVQLPLALRTPAILEFDRVLLARAAPTTRAPLAFGCGTLCGRLLARSIASERAQIEASIEALRADDRHDFFFGLGTGMAEDADSPVLPAAWRAIVAPDVRNSVLQGFGAGLSALHGREQAARMVLELEAGCSTFERAALHAGIAMAVPR